MIKLLPFSSNLSRGKKYFRSRRDAFTRKILDLQCHLLSKRRRKKFKVCRFTALREQVVGGDLESRIWITVSSVQPTFRSCQYYFSPQCTFRSPLTRKPNRVTNSNSKLQVLWLYQYFIIPYVSPWNISILRTWRKAFPLYKAILSCLQETGGWFSSAIFLVTIFPPKYLPTANQILSALSYHLNLLFLVVFQFPWSQIPSDNLQSLVLTNQKQMLRLPFNILSL